MSLRDVRDRLERFFEIGPDPEEARQGLEEATFVLSFAQHQEYKKLMDWLGKQADRPVPLGAHLDMVGGLARANTLKEVRSHLEARVANARRLLDAHREGR